mmetsp:Transcript_5199/g.10349  ORF Transcript_5199/g.10349 Transcript_5199/m.10349 type:complete len:402 (-) Transcript_5199:648-1853(-)
MEGLGVLGTETLVRGGSTGTDNRHRHVELSTSGSVGVACRGNLGHTVDSKVGVHELDDRAVSVHPLSECLAHEVSLVNDLVSSPDLTVCLLRELGDIVGASSLKVLSVHGSGRIAEHLLVDCEVDCVANTKIPRITLCAERGDVSLYCLHLFRRDVLLVMLVSPRWSLPQVVVRIWGVRELELLCELDRRHGAFIGEVHSLLDLPLHLLLDGGKLRLGQDPGLLYICLKDLDGILGGTSPLFLVLPAPLVLRVSGRVSIEPVSMNLQNSRSLLPHVINSSPSPLDNVLYVLPVHQDSRNTIVLALLVYIGVGGDVGGESVDSATVVDDDHEEGEVVLSGGVEDLGHPAILAPTLPYENHTNPIIVLPRSFILLLEIISVTQPQLPILQDGLCRTRGVRELL